MATTTDRQSPYSATETGYRQNDPLGPSVNINQTTTPTRSTGSSAGLFIIGLVVLGAIVLAIYYSAGNYTTTPTVIQNNSSEIVPNPTPVTPAPEPVTEAPALNNQSAEPAPLEMAPAAPAPATPELAPAPAP